jgi:hypothetical protein
VRAYEKVVDLSYGENPHQRAAYYSKAGARTHLLSMVRQHHGKQLSYNNLLDLDAARRLSEDLAGSSPRRRRELRDRQAQQPLRRALGETRASRPTARRLPATR